MKKNFLLGLILCGSFTTINAQISTGAGGGASILPNSPTTNTNVGIGTTTPKGFLEVKGSLPDGQVFTDVNDRNNKSIVLNIGSVVDAVGGWRMIKFFDFPQSNINSKSELYFGLEDRSDFNRFLFSAQTGGNTQMLIRNKSQQELMKFYEDGSDNVFMQFGKPNTRIIIGGYGDYPNSLGHKLFVQNGSAKIEGNILTDANIGIGTSNFVDGANTYRLSVKGKIRAEEIKVYNTWADYVFNTDYKLSTLNEVESFIKQNGHLPNVPSAKEVTEKGLELGEMTKIQQEKIEELTLYLIQQNKEIEELKAQMKILMNKK